MRQSTACWHTNAAGWAGSGRRRPRIYSDQCKGGGGSSGGGGGGTSVDPIALANAQGQQNISTAETQAQLNNLNTFSPYGSTQYAPGQIDPSTGKPSSYNVTQSLSPEFQQLFGTQTGLAQAVAGAGAPFAAAAPGMATTGAGILNRVGGLAGTLPTNIDLSAVPNIGALTPGSFRTDVTTGAGGQPIPGAVTSLPLQTGVNSNFPQLVQQAQDAAYKSQTQYLDPQFKQQEESLRQSLGDQGIEEGTPAFSRAMLDFNNQKQQAYQSAQDQSVAAGNEQQRALFSQALAGGQFTNQAMLAGGQFTNQAQGQLFGQGTGLADLYNQAVLGASGQNLQAQQANLGRAQAAFGAPYSAAQGLTGLGTGIYGTGLGSLAGVLPGVTAWPTGATGIPNLAPGTATGVSPTNVAGAAIAANQARAQNFAQGQTNLSNMLGFGNLGAQALTGNSIGGLFGSGGLLGGGLFGGGLTPAAAGAASGFGDAFGAGAIDLGTIGGGAAAAGGGGGFLGSLAAALPFLA
jgi:hypothetical protein